MNRLRTLRLLVCAAFVALVAAVPAQANLTSKFQNAVSQILAQPYESSYVPLGYDSAFPYGGVLNTFPVQDYTSGSKAGNPDAPPWPIGFELVSFASLDGAPLKGHLARQPGNHPGIVVVHGFNSNGRDSAVRWAAMLARNGYNVLAFDLRGFPPEYRAGGNQPLPNPQTLGWKEAEDVVAAGRFLKAQAGVTSVGVVGWSFGGQETVLALGLEGLLPEASRVFQGRAQLQRAGRPEHADLLDRGAHGMPDAALHVSGDGCAAGPRRAAVGYDQPVHGARTRGRPLPLRGPERAVHDHVSHGRVPEAAGDQRAAPERVRRRRSARRAVPGHDDGRVQRGEVASEDDPASRGAARVLQRSLVAAARDADLLQDAASRCVGGRDDHD